MRLTPGLRARVLEDLSLRERYTLKAIARRYGLSRATLGRLCAELRERGGVSHFDSDKQDSSCSNSPS